MIKFFKYAGILLLIAIVIILITAAVQPNEYKVERSITINADEQTVWDGINKLSSFKAWNPWMALDKETKITLTGQDGTIGNKYAWISKNEQIGQGEMIINKVTPLQETSYQLNFIKPFASSSDVLMTMVKAEDEYKTSWIMSGKQGFSTKLFMLFMGGMDGAIGKDFEKGLSNLKTLCESGKLTIENTLNINYKVLDIDFPATQYAVIKKDKVALADISNFFSVNFSKIMIEGTKAGLKVNGITSGIYYKYDMQNGIANMAAAIPMNKIAKLNGIEWVKIPARKAHQINYYGDYNNMKPAYDEMEKYLKTNNLVTNPEMVIEQYVTDPETEKEPNKWLTQIVFFTK